MLRLDVRTVIALGVDLGKFCGLAVVRLERAGMPRVLATWCLKEPELLELQRAAYQLAFDYHAEIVGFEEPGQWGWRRAVASLSQKGAVVRAAAEMLGARVVPVQPQSVKKGLTGSGLAPKPKVGRFVRAAAGHFAGDENEHVLDAVAIALKAIENDGKAAFEAKIRASAPKRRRAGVPAQGRL